MNNDHFHLCVTVEASAEETMKKINQVDKWWAKKVKGNSEKLNDAFRVDFGTTWVDFTISELIPNKKIVWKVTDCNLQWIQNKKEWNNTEVVFEISQHQHATQIDFTHAGLVPGFECYKDCKEGWTGHVANSLVAFIHKGQGMPE